MITEGEIIMNTEHRQQKISFWHSMKTQFIAVVILVAAVIVILYTLMIMPGVKSNIRSIYSDYLLDLSISYGREMESAMQVNIDLLDNPEAAQDILQQLDIAGAKTAYAYLVGFDGTMLYHPTAEKIGQPVENDAVKKMLKEIQGGSIPKPETVQYVFQGEKKFAACYTSKKQFILVVTADDADLLAPALRLEQRGILISGVLLLLGALAAVCFCNTDYTSVIKDYRFREPDCTAGSAKRSGTGTMCRTSWGSRKHCKCRASDERGSDGNCTEDTAAEWTVV